MMKKKYNAPKIDIFEMHIQVQFMQSSIVGFSNPYANTSDTPTDNENRSADSKYGYDDSWE